MKRRRLHNAACVLFSSDGSMYSRHYKFPVELLLQRTPGIPEPVDVADIAGQMNRAIHAQGTDSGTTTGYSDNIPPVRRIFSPHVKVAIFVFSGQKNLSLCGQSHRIDAFNRDDRSPRRWLCLAVPQPPAPSRHWSDRLHDRRRWPERARASNRQRRTRPAGRRLSPLRRR